MSTIADNAFELDLVRDFSERLRAGLITSESAKAFLSALKGASPEAYKPRASSGLVLTNDRWNARLGRYHHPFHYLNALNQMGMLNRPWQMFEGGGVPIPTSNMVSQFFEAETPYSTLSKTGYVPLIQVSMSDLGYPAIGFPASFEEVCETAISKFGFRLCLREEILVMCVETFGDPLKRKPECNLTFGMKPIKVSFAGDMHCTFGLRTGVPMPQLQLMDGRPERKCSALEQFVFAEF